MAGSSCWVTSHSGIPRYLCIDISYDYNRCYCFCYYNYCCSSFCYRIPSPHCFGFRFPIDCSCCPLLPANKLMNESSSKKLVFIRDLELVVHAMLHASFSLWESILQKRDQEIRRVYGIPKKNWGLMDIRTLYLSISCLIVFEAKSLSPDHILQCPVSYF